MLFFSFFGPPKALVSVWIIELEKYIGKLLSKCPGMPCSAND
jgi:hypothetical protein